jgi:hypothetical protein
LSAVLSFFKFIYRHKEKIVLGVMVVAFAGMAYFQWKAKQNEGINGNGGTNSGDNGKQNEGPPPRDPQKFNVPPITNQYPVEKYVQQVTKKDIFVEPARQTDRPDKDEPKAWADINIKSIFDPTGTGSFIAIIEVDNRRRFVKEGEQFDDYTVQRIDGVRNCLTIAKRGETDEREFCREE